MAQFRTSADLIDTALRKSGEVTSGTSAYETIALDSINSVYHSLISGGTIPIGKDMTVEIDEVWPWSKADAPLIIELQPKYTTGTVAFTLGSEAGTFSTGPASSLVGYHIRINGKEEIYKIASHTAAATAFEIDGLYPDATVTGASFEAFKIDYDLIPSMIVINSKNNKLQFQEVAGTTLTATLTSGTYTPSALATEVQTQMNTTGGTPVYTVSYSATTRKFTIASDRGGGAVFVLVGTGDQSLFSAHKTLGFDDENTTNAASVVSTYELGGIARLIEPFKVHKGSGDDIGGIDAESFSREYPLSSIREGIPSRFCVMRESSDGVFSVRFDAFPREKTRIEIEYVPVPRDLKDSSSSIPLVPRKHVDVLVDAAVFYIMLDKSDDRADKYAMLLYGKLKSMIAQHRGSMVRSGKHFGQIISRKENLKYTNRRLKYGYD